MNDVSPVDRDGFPSWRKCRILNAWVDDLTVEQVVDRLDEGILWTLNPDHLYHLQRNRAFVDAYRQAAIVSSDSKYVYWGLKFLGRKIQAKASGSDIVPAYWRRHAQNPDVRIFLLGARPGIAEIARQRINGAAGRRVVVGAHGPSMNFVDDEAESAEAVRMITESGATCLIVGLGAPKQEVWIVKHRHLMPNVRVYMGVGATIDYEADAVKRAPGWMTQNGLEWVYRMATEPRRYWRRYARQLEFLWLVLLDRIGLYRAPAQLGETTVATHEIKAA